MFPQPGQGINRQAHLNTAMSSSTVQGIPGMPSSAMVPSGAGAASSGFALQHGFVGNIPLSQVSSGPFSVQPNNSKMWQQPQQHAMHHDVQNQHPHQKDLKHRDYLKQQQRLKAMPLSSSKGMSADALIGNLLEKKDTFTLRQTGQVAGQSKQSGSGDRIEPPVQMAPLMQPGQPDPTMNRGLVGSLSSVDNLPGWLIPSSSRLPPIYAHIWSLVCDPASGGTLVDTNKILALLLTSGLPKEVLGFIWNLATNGANVQLNQQQLYLTLALVALAQMGCTFNNLSVLNFIPTPPIPSFNMNISKAGTDDKQKKPEVTTIKPTAPVVTAPPPLCSMTPSTAAPPVFSTDLNQVEEDDFGDEFTDFQSADTSYIPPPNLSNLCSSLPDTAVIQPSIAAKQVVNELNHSVVSKLGRSQGRAIGSRLANHHLGAPKSSASQKPRRPSVEHDFCVQSDLGVEYERNSSHLQDSKTSLKHSDYSENEDFSDYQIAAGLNVNVDELFPKCHPKPKSQEFTLKESAIRSESDDEDAGMQKEVELLAFDSPGSVQPPVLELKVVPAPMEIPLVSPPASKSTKELMAVEEDKYSALRWIELENSSKAIPELRDASGTADTDDFGDFVSADDMFEEIAVREPGSSGQTPIVPLNSILKPPDLQSVEFAVDDWATSEFQSAKPAQETPVFEPQIISSNSKAEHDDLSSAFFDLDLSKGNNDPPKVTTSSKWSFDLDIGRESSSLNLNASFGNNVPTNDDDFGDFVGPDSAHIDDSNRKTSSGFLGDQMWNDNSSKIVSDNKSVSSLELPGVTISRHGSLPSLDLNLFPASDDMGDKILSSQVADWMKCLDSSCSLLQAAATTFTSITAHSVLMEVLGATEGRNYLNNLLEVHRVTWRIHRSYQRSGHESNQIDSIINGIQKVWSTLQTFYKLANIESAVEKDGSDEESGQPACGVCGSPASRGVLEYGRHVYHAPCANLWLNCVDRTLPAHSPLL